MNSRFLPLLLRAFFFVLVVSFSPSVSSAQTNTPKTSGVELIRNGDFEAVTKHWYLEQIAPAKGDFFISDEGPKGERCAIVELLTPAETHWKMSLIQKELKVTAGKRYLVSFWAKSSARRWVSVGFKQHLAPYKSLAFENDVEIGTEWSQITLILKPTESENNTRFSVGNIGQILGTFWFTKFSIIEQ
jgi:hypothetical protein